MGYLDYAGLQYLWSKLKEKFAPKSHSHDDRYYTESEMDGKLNSKVNNNEAGANGLINKLSTADGIPNDATVFISQHNDGKTASYYRRPISTLWTYIKSKADSVYQPKGSYAASSHTHDDRYYTETEINSKLNGKAVNITLSKVDLNTVKTPGFYNAGGGNGCTNVPVSDAFGLIVTHNANGEYYTQIFFLVDKNTSYRRYCNGGTWSRWTQDKYTDTNTWRGIQNNLTSDSTTDSLSAAQGKALKTLVDGKAPNGHTHSFDSITGKPSTYTPSAHNQSWNTITDKPALMESGDYSAETIEALLKRVQGLSPRMGSCCLAKDTHVANTWWNFIYTPHRTGFGGDNPEYGTLLLFPMVGAGSSYIVRAGKDGVVKEIRKIYTSGDKPTKGDVGLGNVDNTADKNKSVASAAKLTTARTVSGGSDITLSFNYDGSGNSTANIGFYSCKHNVDNTNNYPFHRFARLDVNKGAWVDKSITFLISQDYSGGGYGICRLVYRSNADSGNASVDAQWLVRRGFSADTIQVAIKTDKTNGAYCDAFYKSSGTYMGVVIRAIASGGRATSGRTWTLVDSNEVGGTTATDKKTSSECWKTIADAGTALHKQAYSASAPAKDEGYVASAGSANTSSSCTGNSASATKLTSSAGSATQPVYFKDGKPVAGTYTLGDASSKTVRTLGAVGNTGWANKTTDDKYIPTMSFMAYWNGAYSGTSSNLQYCDRGRFGTIVTKGSGDYAAAGHTHNYAGSGSAGGSANSAVKLDSNAGSSVQPVYFSGGKPVAIGYTISSSVPANAKFTDTTYGVASSSSNGLMSSTDKTKLDDFSRVINIQKQIKLTTDWLDTGIAGNSLDTGTYVVQVSGFNSSYTQLYSEIYSGVMSWYSGTTNSGNSSEIFLHNAGLADNNNAIYLRTLRVAGSKTLKLQIACKVAATGTDTLTFKFRRLI